MALNLILQRYSDNGNSTQGLMHTVENNSLRFLNYSLEDEHRDIKVKGETCIPTGTYEIKQRKLLTDMTKRYRAKYGWFDWHLELQNVEGFQFIYIHSGNKQSQTDGCLLVQDNANNNMIGAGFNSSSVPAYKRLYIMIRGHLNDGNKVFIKIRDVNHLM